MEFYAHHGYFKEEQKLGNRFTVDIELTTDITQAGKTDDLQYTTDYSQVYRIISEILDKNVSLLEHIAYEVNKAVLGAFKEIESVEVSVVKHNPPVGGLCEKAKVTLRSSR